MYKSYWKEWTEVELFCKYAVVPAYFIYLKDSKTNMNLALDVSFCLMNHFLADLISKNW